MSSPYATVEPHVELWFEEANYIATHIAAICYGILVTVFFIASYHVFRWRASPIRRIFWHCFLFLLLAIATVNIACSINFNQSAWIDERNYPGGPYQFLTKQQSRPVLTVGNTASIMGSFAADGILLYRVMVLYNFVWYIVILPTLFYIACVVLSILTVIQIADPAFANIVNLSFPVWLVLMIINIVLSAMIAFRILAMRRAVKSGLGEEYAKPYGTIASIIVEAALPFTILSIILLALFGGRDTAQNLFVPLLVQVEVCNPSLSLRWALICSGQCLAPVLIILRVIIRGSSEDDRVKPNSGIRFASTLRVDTESTWANGPREKQGKKGDDVLRDDDSFGNVLHSHIPNTSAVFRDTNTTNPD
ncbi:hypothetical protein C0991_006708 [Blastosporella zonata]|nr:hypothetical protein C0991_006708 [Blastosporella zonata]